MSGIDTSGPDVSVVIVSYNTCELLRACLESVERSEGTALEVFVVDNASADNSVAMVRAAFPAVRLTVNRENLGFAAANNLALPAARGRYVLLLNPDTVLGPDTVAGLVAFADAHPDVGICGPRVVNEDGSLQSCGYRFPTPLDEIRQSKNVDRWLRAVIGEQPPLSEPRVPCDVDWVDGCCFLIRRTTIDQIGLLDEQYFLYGEELDWCRSARRAGWRVCAVPSVSMAHLLGRSVAQVRAEGLALLVETRLRYYRKHDGLLVALAMSVVNTLGFLKRWRDEPDKNRAKMRGVRSWWRSLVSSAPRGRHSTNGRPAVATRRAEP